MQLPVLLFQFSFGSKLKKEKKKSVKSLLLILRFFFLTVRPLLECKATMPFSLIYQVSGAAEAFECYEFFFLGQTWLLET